jgi:hypothetical protein
MLLDGHFLKSHGFECADDDAAIERAQQFLESRDVELWCGGPFIVSRVQSACYAGPIETFISWEIEATKVSVS